MLMDVQSFVKQFQGSLENMQFERLVRLSSREGSLQLRQIPADVCEAMCRVSGLL